MAKIQHTVKGCIPIDKSVIEAYVALVNTDKYATEREDDRQATEGQGAYSDTTLYPNTRRAKEADRQANELERQAAEGTPSDERGANTRWGAEKQRQYQENIRQQQEGDPETSTAGDGSRWGNYKQAEAERDVISAEDHRVAVADHGTASDDHITAVADHGTAGDDHTAATAATARANEAAAVAEHMVDIHRGPKGDQGNTGSSVDYPYELVNNLTTDDAEKGLSAAMGKLLAKGYTFMGVATPNTTPEVTNRAIFFLASQPGTYTNFIDSSSNALVVNDGEVCVLVYSTAWSKQVTGAATEAALASFDGRKTATLRRGLPMIDELTSAYPAITSAGCVLTPRILSNFLLDMHFVGTPTTGCKYVLWGFQYQKNGSVSYANYLYIRRINADSTETQLANVQIGRDAPVGIVKHTINLSGDSGVTKCILLLNWDALAELPVGINYCDFRLTNNGYVFDQEYLFGYENSIVRDEIFTQYGIDIVQMRSDIGQLIEGVDGRKAGTLRGGLPMIDEVLSVYPTITSVNRTLTPRVLSNFLLDMHFVGTPTAGCKYVLSIFQYAKNGSVTYANNILITRINADSSETTLANVAIGANAPAGTVKHTFDLSDDSGVSKCILVLNWDALAEIDDGSSDYGVFQLTQNGYVFNQSYLFGNDNSIAFDEKFYAMEEGRKAATLHYGLPMIDELLSTYQPITSANRTLTPRVLSNFLLDMRFVGTPMTGCKYVLNGFQYAKNGSVPYANCLFIRRINADNSETDLAIVYIGTNAPSGVVRHTINLQNDTGVTKCILLLNWAALAEIDNGSSTYSSFWLATNGYVFNQSYLFESSGPIEVSTLRQDVNALQQDAGQDLEITIPSTIYAIAGTELYLYNDSIALSMDRGLSSPLNYQILWNCTKGAITERGFKFTPSDTDAGQTFSATCYLYSPNFVLLQQKTFTIKVVAKNAISSAKNIVYFGDSLGAGSASALRLKFNDSERFTGTIPQMLGTRGTTPKYEAVGGYTWADYATRGRKAYRVSVSGVQSVSVGAVYSITIESDTIQVNIREVNITEGSGNLLMERTYGEAIANFPSSGTLTKVSGAGDSQIPFTNGFEESGNPLWNDTTNQLDISLYKTRLGLSASDKIDAVSFLLGLNDAFDETTIRGYISDLYNAFVSDNPNCKFIIGLTTLPGNTLDGYGANYGAGGAGFVSMKQRFDNFRKLYISMVGSDYPNLRIATPGLQIDRYYGFPFGTRVISQEYEETESYHTNYVHPSTGGYRQIGDSFLAAFVAALSE